MLRTEAEIAELHRVSDMLHAVLKVLPTDYTDYGGQVERWADDERGYPDCSCGCKWYVQLEGDLGLDWGVCCSPNSPRSGLLTFEHQTGVDCCEFDEEEDAGEEEE